MCVCARGFVFPRVCLCVCMLVCMCLRTSFWPKPVLPRGASMRRSFSLSTGGVGSPAPPQQSWGLAVGLPPPTFERAALHVSRVGTVCVARTRRATVIAQDCLWNCCRRRVCGVWGLLAWRVGLLSRLLGQCLLCCGFPARRNAPAVLFVPCFLPARIVVDTCVLNRGGCWRFPPHA